VDLDKLIELKTAISVSDIFLSQGEEQFRNLESDCLKEILNQNDTSSGSAQALVASLGDGTHCNDENIKLLKEKAFTIYLKVSVNPFVHFKNHLFVHSRAQQHTNIISSHRKFFMLAVHKHCNLNTTW